MPKPTLRIFILASLFAICFGISACGGGIPSDAVVQVGGKPITKATFKHWMVVASSSSVAAAGGKPVVPEPPGYTACIARLQASETKPVKGQKKKTPAELKTQCEQQYTTLKQQVLGFLISADWVLGEAEAMKVTVSNKTVEQEFEKIKKQQYPKAADFEKFLASSGETVSDLLLRVRLDSLSTKIQQKVTKDAKSVSEAQLQKYYEQHKSQYGQAEKRNLRIVLTKTEAQAKSAQREIESGKSFASVAKAHSIDPVSKAAGGSLPGVVKGQEEKALSEAVFAAKKGVLGGPVKTPFGYYVYEVTGITPSSQQTFAQAKATIKQTIAAEGQQKALSSFVKEFQKRWTAKTECLAEYSVQDCKGYKAPKTTSTAAPATTTPQTTSTPAPTTSTGAKKK